MTPNPTVKQSLTVPLEPTEEMIDVAVSFALNVSLSGEYNWSAYMRDVWQRMVKAAPAEPSQEAVAWMVSGGDSRAKSYDTYPAWAGVDSELIITALYNAPPSPDAELVELLGEVRKRCPLPDWARERIDAKLAGL